MMKAHDVVHLKTVAGKLRIMVILPQASANLVDFDISF